MTVYGTRIIHDLPLSLQTPAESDVRYSLHLNDRVPKRLRTAMRCGTLLYQAHGRRVFLYTDRPLTQSAHGQPWCYEAEGLGRFYWYGGDDQLHCEPRPGVDWMNVEFWLLHLVLPLRLTLDRHYHFFHAGAVEVDGGAVLFLAPSMGGKSTMTDCFLRRGHGLISDDKVATFREKDRIMVVPAHPYHRPWRSFEDLGQRAGHYVAQIRPLRTLYLLERAAPDTSVTFEEIRGMKKLREILPHFLYPFPFLKREQLAYLAPLLGTLPLIRVTVPWDLERLDEVHDAICMYDAKSGEQKQ